MASKKNNLMTISSGKGGVGKTFLSITLAHAFALQGKKILLIDADIGLANIDIQLGIVPKKDLGHVFCDQLSLENAVISHEGTGFDLIAGRSGSGFFGELSAMFLNKLIKDIIVLGRNYDQVIIDVEAGIGQLVKEFIKSSSFNLVLLNEEPTSLTDAYALIKVTRILNPYVVITNTSTPEQGKNIFNALSKATHKFIGIAPTYLGSVPKDKNVPAVIRLQMPILNFAPKSMASEAITEISNDIIKFSQISNVQVVTRS